ncbi:hypothetical protein AB0N06_35530 [Streptomyces sp. NPDC051020]|uniref:hypothetical protein n=1 Tax=Streptomyces sp. NPDC051020 TaxID=3155409 RepID=UPI00344678DC
MRIRQLSAALAAATAVLTVGLFAGPASAYGPTTRHNGEPACETGAVCVYESASFEGATVWYRGESLGTDCVTLPFGAHGDINATSKKLLHFATADCTGYGLTEPAGGMHTWPASATHSFRVSS